MEEMFAVEFGGICYGMVVGMKRHRSIVSSTVMLVQYLLNAYFCILNEYIHIHSRAKNSNESKIYDGRREKTSRG